MRWPSTLFHKIKWHLVCARTLTKLLGRVGENLTIIKAEYGNGYCDVVVYFFFCLILVNAVTTTVTVNN